MAKQKKLSLEDLCKIIELIMIPNAMENVARQDKEMEKLKQQDMQNTMFYGFHYGLRAGELENIENLKKIVKSIRGY